MKKMDDRLVHLSVLIRIMRSSLGIVVFAKTRHPLVITQGAIDVNQIYPE